MSTDTIAPTEYTETEALLLALPGWSGFHVNPNDPAKRFVASIYPNGDVGKDPCYGRGPTLAAALEEAMHNVNLVKNQSPELRTARDVKEAVIKLIGEHKAAPASFRAAVDSLRVRSY